MHPLHRSSLLLFVFVLACSSDPGPTGISGDSPAATPSTETRTNPGEEPDATAPVEDGVDPEGDVTSGADEPDGAADPTEEDTGPACNPFCIAKECGDDGCGGSCGTCPEEAPICDLGYCVVPCEPDCDGKECGVDGCGGYCGTCPPELPHCGVTSLCELDPACEPGLCTVSGTVLAPEGTIPIAGALVRLVKEMPEAKYNGAICDACVLPAYYEPHAFSGYDGTFSFDVPEKGTWHLVVQKGGFRRIRSLEVVEGGQLLPADMTTLPAVHDPEQGDEIPRMAVSGDGFDAIEGTLAKLGLGQVDSWGDLIPGTESFDVYDTWGSELNAEELFTDFGLLQEYQVVFIPCDSGWSDDLLTAPQVLENLRNYVAMGGRLYVTDWSYDVLAKAFPGPISWADQTNELGSAELYSSYDAPAVDLDPGLEAWLQAQGIADFELEDNWTAIHELSSYTAENEFGVELEMEPVTWVHADLPSTMGSDTDGVRPATVSFQYGCGRSMFSTYHTEGGAGTGLMAQERALLYIILEVAACIGHVPMSPPGASQDGPG